MEALLTLNITSPFSQILACHPFKIDTPINVVQYSMYPAKKSEKFVVKLLRNWSFSSRSEEEFPYSSPQ